MMPEPKAAEGKPKMLKRCYKCGRVKCETCGGSHMVKRAHPTLNLLKPCPDCENGWRQAVTLRGRGEGQAPPDEGCRLAWTEEHDDMVFCGLDPAVLCPKCKLGLDSARRALEDTKEPT